MSWHTVVIDSGDQYAKDTNAKTLIDTFTVKYQAAGVPPDVEVWHKRDVQGNHVYQFSPMASSIGEELLRPRGAIACAAKPDLTGYKMIPI